MNFPDTIAQEMHGEKILSLANAEPAEDIIKDLLCYFISIHLPQSDDRGSHVDGPKVNGEVTRNALCHSHQRLVSPHQSLRLTLIHRPGDAASR